MNGRDPEKLISDLISGDPLSRRKRAFLKQHIMQINRRWTGLELQALDLLGVDLANLQR